MQALVLHAIKAPLTLQSRTEATPAPGEVVVHLRAAALNRRDYWITQGMYPGINPPVVLGSDGAGVVSRCGVDVDPQWQGRDVIINPGLDWGADPNAQSTAFTILGLPRDGTFASELVVPAEQLFAKPPHLDWEEAAALPLAGVTGYRALFTQGGASAGQTVLITGIGGGVATMVLQFAVAAGCEVWVTSSSAEKIDRAVELGARGGFDYRQPDWTGQFLQAARPAHLIIDSAAGKGYANLLAVAAPGGRIVNYGATTGPPDQLDLFKVFWKQLRLQGTTMGSPADFAAMLNLVNKKSLHPVVDRVMPLADGNAAIELMKSAPQFGKLVLSISTA